MNAKLTLYELEKYFAKAATLLQSHVNAGAYKQYIFPLLFFKRLCDVYDEHPEKEHLFNIPDGAHWNNVCCVENDIGTALENAFHKIEAANPEKLQGIFGDATWANKNRLPDELLKELLEHFSTKNLSLANCPADELGHGYEILLKKYAEDRGHTAQEFYANPIIIKLMTEILEPKCGDSIYDPTCGSAGMLVSAVAYLKAQNKEWQSLSLYGQEISAFTSAIARMNLLLHGIANFEIETADTLQAPAFIEQGELKTFNVVLANPPYSIKTWDQAAFENDKYGRNFLGTSRQGRADYAFFQHIIKSMDEKDGRCAILFPHGILFRKDEKEMREKLIQLDLVDCVIGLGPYLFYNSSMETCVVICRKNKPATHKGHVLFIDAINEITGKKLQQQAGVDHVAQVAETYRKFESDGEKTIKVSNAHIAENDYSLNIPLYVKSDTSEPDDERTIQECYASWLDSSKTCNQTLHQMINLLEPEI